MAETIWMYGIPGGFHDYHCQCDRHCRNCFEDLDVVRETRSKMISEGTIPATDQLGPRERYCSSWCRNHAKRERALDRAISEITAR